MKDIHEVLKQKESDCARLNEEVEALRLVVPLLKDQGTPANGTEDLVLEPEPVVEEQSELEEQSVLEEQGSSNLKEGVSTEEIAEADRKSPLSATLGESSWWRRRQSR